MMTQLTANQFIQKAFDAEITVESAKYCFLEVNTSQVWKYYLLALAGIITIYGYTVCNTLIIDVQ